MYNEPDNYLEESMRAYPRDEAEAEVDWQDYLRWLTKDRITIKRPTTIYEKQNP